MYRGRGGIVGAWGERWAAFNVDRSQRRRAEGWVESAAYSSAPGGTSSPLQREQTALGKHSVEQQGAGVMK